MIPNIFISSTIADLHYLRDAIRDAILELAYNPIMSDYGEVGYISPAPAAESCYRTVRQCQLAVLILGRRYGSIGKDGNSVTHREFLTAKEHRIPTIAFVESQVMNYKEVYDVDRTALTWSSFPGMDHPHKTFGFIDEVQKSEFYNGLIPITTAGEVKRLLKLQIADFVGEKLNDVIRPVKSEVQEILAELKTLRKEMAPTNQPRGEAEKYLQTMRFLLDDRRAGFRKFCEELTDDLDSAVPLLIQHPSLEAFIAALSYRTLIEDSKENFDLLMRSPVQQQHPMRYASHSTEGWWAMFDDKRVVFNTTQFERFKATYATLQRILAMV